MRGGGGGRSRAAAALTSRAPTIIPHPTESPRIEPFDVEYYRTLSGGNYREIFRSAIFTPQPPLVGRRSKNFRARNA